MMNRRGFLASLACLAAAPFARRLPLPAPVEPVFVEVIQPLSMYFAPGDIVAITEFSDRYLKPAMVVLVEEMERNILRGRYVGRPEGTELAEFLDPAPWWSSQSSLTH